MDMKETSAMTEASGLVEDRDGAGPTPAAQPAGPADAGRPRPSDRSSQGPAAHWADQLREVTVKAPLPSLFVAFLLGVWFARRR